MAPRRDLQAAAAALSARLGVRLAPDPLLEEALTHPSAGSPSRPDNQRLEFLGDRVLNLVVAEQLIRRAPLEAEGKLAPRLNALVRKETCAEAAAELGLGDMLRLGRSEHATGGRRKTAVLGDAMEAVIGAVYVGHGMDAARAAVLALWDGRLEAAAEAPAPTDAKTALQEWAQARGLPPPAYETLGRAGPDHAPVFEVAVRLVDGRVATGAAASKRAAQQEAATRLLATLQDPV